MLANSPSARPFVAFDFAVEITLPGSGAPLCRGAFAECDGLEITMDVKSIRQGGANGSMIRLAGPLAYGQVSLKRGMTETSFELWDWMQASVADPALRAEAEVTLFGADGHAVRARWMLRRCLPVKIKAPPLNAKDGVVAIEELGLAYDELTLRRP